MKANAQAKFEVKRGNNLLFKGVLKASNLHGLKQQMINLMSFVNTVRWANDDKEIRLNWQDVNTTEKVSRDEVKKITNTDVGTDSQMACADAFAMVADNIHFVDLPSGNDAVEFEQLTPDVDPTVLDSITEGLGNIGSGAIEAMGSVASGIGDIAGSIGSGIGDVLGSVSFD